MHAGARRALLGPKGGDSLTQPSQQTGARIRVKRGDEQGALGAVERDGARRIQGNGTSSEDSRMAAGEPPKTPGTPRPAGRSRAALLRLPKRNTSRAPLKLGASHSRLATSLATKHGLPEQSSRPTRPVIGRARSAAVARQKAVEGERVPFLQLHVALQQPSSFACPLLATHRCAKLGGSAADPFVSLASPASPADPRIRPRFEIQTARDSTNGLHGPMPRLPIPEPSLLPMYLLRPASR